MTLHWAVKKSYS